MTRALGGGPRVCVIGLSTFAIILSAGTSAQAGRLVTLDERASSPTLAGSDRVVWATTGRRGSAMIKAKRPFSRPGRRARILYRARKPRRGGRTVRIGALEASARRLAFVVEIVRPREALFARGGARVATHIFDEAFVPVRQRLLSGPAGGPYRAIARWRAGQREVEPDCFNRRSNIETVDVWGDLVAYTTSGLRCERGRQLYVDRLIVRDLAHGGRRHLVEERTSGDSGEGAGGPVRIAGRFVAWPLVRRGEDHVALYDWVQGRRIYELGAVDDTQLGPSDALVEPQAFDIQGNGTMAMESKNAVLWFRPVRRPRPHRLPFAFLGASPVRIAQDRILFQAQFSGDIPGRGEFEAVKLSRLDGRRRTLRVDTDSGMGLAVNASHAVWARWDGNRSLVFAAPIDLRDR